MSVEATAAALAPETSPEPVKVEVTETPQMTDDDLMAQVWDDRNKEEEPETPEDAPVEAAETDEPVEEPEGEVEEGKQEEQEAPKPPSTLPPAVQRAWADLPEDVREAVQTSHKEMGDKLAAQGRQMQGIAPVRDALVEMVQDIPEMANLRPEQVIREMKQFRDSVIVPLNQKPVETILQVARQRGIEGQLRAALDGQQPGGEANYVAALTKELNSLKQQLQQVADPNYMRQHLETFTTQTEAENVVQEFAQQAEHWSEVENTLPASIAYVQSVNPDLSQRDILERAYDLEIQRLGKAKPKASEKDTPEADPEQTQKALKAKSVNVSGRSSGKSKPVTEDQLLEQVWRKNQA